MDAELHRIQLINGPRHCSFVYVASTADHVDVKDGDDWYRYRIDWSRGCGELEGFAPQSRKPSEVSRLRDVNAEMLAALRRGCESLEDAIRTTDEQVPPGWTKYNRESLEMMRAAIARAEGAS